MYIVNATDREAFDKAIALIKNNDPSLVYIKFKNVSNEDLEKLMNALKNNSTITSLDLSNNKIDDNGATAIADALKVNYTMTKLNLKDNSIDSKILEEIDKLIKINIESLALSVKDFKENKQVLNFKQKQILLAHLNNNSAKIKEIFPDDVKKEFISRHNIEAVQHASSNFVKKSLPSDIAMAVEEFLKNPDINKTNITTAMSYFRKPAEQITNEITLNLNAMMNYFYLTMLH